VDVLAAGLHADNGDAFLAAHQARETKMRIRQYFAEGILNVFRSARIILAIYLVSLGLSIPLTIGMRNVLEHSLDSSLAREKLRSGFDLDWYGEFEAAGSSFARTFGPSVIGILPVAGDVERILDGTLFEVDSIVLLPAAVLLLVWAFLGGGIIGRYSRPLEPWSAADFVRNSAEYFFRFVRLTILSIALYFAITKWVAVPLHRWVESATRDVTVERIAMAYTGLVYLVVLVLLVLLALTVDYAKILLVLTRRRSSLLAFVDSVRFILANSGATIGLYLLLGIIGIVILVVYAGLAPGPTQSSVSGLAASFVLTQAFVIARIILKLWFLASQTALCDSRRAAGIQAAAGLPVPAGAGGSEDAGGGI
jgi:hypothetical protein